MLDAGLGAKISLFKIPALMKCHERQTEGHLNSPGEEDRGGFPGEHHLTRDIKERERKKKNMSKNIQGITIHESQKQDIEISINHRIDEFWYIHTMEHSNEN